MLRCNVGATGVASELPEGCDGGFKAQSATERMTNPITTRRALRLLTLSIPAASAWITPAAASLTPSPATRPVTARPPPARKAPSLSTPSSARSLAMVARTALDEVSPLVSQRAACWRRSRHDREAGAVLALLTCPGHVAALKQVSSKGEFQRKDAVFRNWVRAGDSEFPPEAGRYHLCELASCTVRCELLALNAPLTACSTRVPSDISKACPWANRCWAVLKMKGLEKAIGVSIVHPTWQATRPGQDQHCGWAFASPTDAPFSSSAGHGSFPPTGCIPDTVNGAKFVRDLYELAKDAGGKYTVPVLWDKKKQTIVSNESADIIQVRARQLSFS
jgi:hypothetical protein